MTEINALPAPGRTLDGSELVPIFQDFFARQIPLRTILGLAAAASASSLVSAKGFGATGDGVSNDSAAVIATVAAARRNGILSIGAPTYTGTTLVDLGGTLVADDFALTYTKSGGTGRTLINRRGRTRSQDFIGRGYLARFWNILSLFSTYSCPVVMAGDSVTAGYVGPQLVPLLQGTPAITSVTNNAIGGTTIEQWRTGTGPYASSGKALADCLALNPALLYIAFGINTPYYGGSPSDFATSLENALITIRAALDTTKCSVFVHLPLASRDGGAMSIEGGWKRDEYFVHELRGYVEPLVDKYGIAVFDPTVDVPESDPDYQGANGYIWLDSTGVHPLYGYPLYLAGRLFDLLVPATLRGMASPNSAFALSAATGFTQPTIEPMRSVRRSDLVQPDGYVRMTTPGALTSGQVLATVATGHKPAIYKRDSLLTLFSSVSGTWEQIRGEIDSITGQVKTGSASVMSPDRVYLGGGWSAA